MNDVNRLSIGLEMVNKVRGLVNLNGSSWGGSKGKAGNIINNKSSASEQCRPLSNLNNWIFRFGEEQETRCAS